MPATACLERGTAGIRTTSRTLARAAAQQPCRSRRPWAKRCSPARIRPRDQNARLLRATADLDTHGLHALSYPDLDHLGRLVSLDDAHLAAALQARLRHLIGVRHSLAPEVLQQV